MQAALAKIIRNLPHKPGVYLYQDQGQKIIYIGKAKDLKKRVSSYFKPDLPDLKTRALVAKIVSVSTIVTNSEEEALLLEASLINKHQPYYNIDLKDDKRFPYFRLSVQEPYPRLTIVRERRKDGARYFGPYAGSIKKTEQLLHKLFLLRKCEQRDLTKIKKACFYQQLGQCLAPCVQQTQYDNEVKKVIAFLTGDYQEVFRQLKSEMQQAAQAREYERAAQLRDQLQELEKIAVRQHVVAPDLISRDIWQFAENTVFVVGTLLLMQNGHIIGSRKFSARKRLAADDNYRARTLLHYYQEQESFPAEIILARQEISPELPHWLAKKQIKLIYPRGGFRAELLKLAEKNVLQFLQDKMLSAAPDETGQTSGPFRLKEIFELPKLPERVECFDISNLQSSDIVGAMVVFQHGRLAKNEYRRYLVHQDQPDDFSAMDEVLTRRYYKVFSGESQPPDFIVIDGGKGQVSVASSVLKNLGLSIPLVGIAKRAEELFIPGRKNPLILKRSDPGLKFIQRLRDEAHRFVIGFHRQRRSKRILGSATANP